ncbi:hypothetical protein EDD15DRAFT_2390537 [Pisolithus albus]|nr:hypothetical protein EDD15DRAFT_2390537 [Pisolithus albus]
MSPQKDVYLVIGGSGFVGRHVVEHLLARGDVVRHHDVPFYLANITDEQDVLDVLKKSGTTCIIHTASPQHGAKDPSLYYKINVGGTRAVVNAAITAGVRKLVYTSSAVSYSTAPTWCIWTSECPIRQSRSTRITDSKVQGEKIVLEANGKGGLLTVALRPAGVFGLVSPDLKPPLPGDRQMMASLYQVHQRGQTHIQVGDNNNLFDYTYVGNVAQAHLLAADKLVPPPLYSSVTCSEPKSDPENTANARVQLFQSLHRALPPVCATTGYHRTPHSSARPLGPYVTPPLNSESILSAFNTPFDPHELKHPIVRSRFDQFSENALAVAEGDPLRVDGQAFFITNGEPVYFWDFTRYVWMALDPPTPEGSKNQRAERKIIKIPRAFGMILGLFSEYWSYLIGREPTFTRFRVSYTCAQRYHCIERARRVLGFVPEKMVEVSAHM